MTITWLGHSCFILCSGGFRVLLDPFRDVPGLPDVAVEADAVYCSHGHFDHAYTDRLRLTAGGRSPFTVTEIPSFHDDRRGALRGENTIRRFDAEGVSVAHLGDLGHQLDGAQLAALRGVDALLLPVGGVYTVDARGAKAVADAVGARVTIPMHYRGDGFGLAELATVEDFAALYPARAVRRCPGNALELTGDTPAQVAVLSLRSCGPQAHSSSSGAKV